MGRRGERGKAWPAAPDIGYRAEQEIDGGPCLPCPPPRLQANDTMQNKSPCPLSGALTTLRSLPYIKAEAKRRQEEKGEPSVARTCLLSLLDLAKIHLLLFTAVCITEEARRRAEKEGE